MMSNVTAILPSQTVRIQTPKAALEADVYLPEQTLATILFAHNAGSSRQNPQNLFIAEMLQREGFATLLIDLLTAEEERLDVLGKLSYDIPLLAGRLDSAAEWVNRHEVTAGLPIGYFGAGTGAAAALVASLQKPDTLGAIVSRGGRVDLAENILPDIKPPTLFIVECETVESLNKNKRMARKTLTEKKLVAVSGAAEFYEEPPQLNEIAELTVSWFRKHLLEDHALSQPARPGPHIDSCSFGRIRVDGKDYRDDLIIYPEKQVVNWWRKDNHSVCFHDIKDVISRKPDLLIVGNGTIGHLRLELSVVRMLQKYNIPCRQAKTQEAAVLFNREIERGVRATGAFHLTC